MYCTFMPCLDCFKACVASGISKVIYKEKYDKPMKMHYVRVLEYLKAIGGWHLPDQCTLVIKWK